MKDFDGYLAAKADEGRRLAEEGRRNLEERARARAGQSQPLRQQRDASRLGAGGAFKPEWARTAYFTRRFSLARHHMLSLAKDGVVAMRKIGATRYWRVADVEAFFSGQVTP